jgi:hypothetical protein
MADLGEHPAGALPPPTEEIHLPDPSYMPVVLAFGLTIAIVGIVFSWVIVALGGLIFLFALLRWIGQVRHEMAQLPLGH